MRQDLPTGTVTFLFTDVEGSTRLLHELGAERYAQALAEHRRIVREACAASDGAEVDTQGDAFFFAFPSASGAVAAAMTVTEVLAPGPIRLRIGLHTGTPLVTDEGYVGNDVHFAARVAAAGHGGQVLLSKSARELVDGPSLTDLGEHRLKDIEGAVSIYQLGDKSFPPLKTISNTNLPRPASSFIGREREREEVVRKLHSGTRLLTLTGPGGSGKTRLALEAAAELVPAYQAGVFWVGLASIRESSLVMEAIAQTLGARDSLVQYIGEREMLLLLDNLEQVIEAAPELSGLVAAACPNLALLVTSRELLRVHGEVEYAVPPLASSEAVLLFCERSRLEPSDEITELCDRLDDLPLAVELAAARTKALTPAQILDRLSDRLDLLRGGRDADARQQTLRATIAWSYDLMSQEEQRVFRALSVFADGCTLAAAEDVAKADVDSLQSLVEKNLLRFTSERYWMLETIREFAAELCREAGDWEDVSDTHAEFFLAWIEQARQRLHDDDAAWLSRYKSEQANLRQALEYAAESLDDDITVDLVLSLADFWYIRGDWSDYGKWVGVALERTDEEHSERRARLLGNAATCVQHFGDAVLARNHALAALAIFRELGDSKRVAWMLTELGSIAKDRGDYVEARECIEEAAGIARAVGDDFSAATALGNLAAVVAEQGDYRGAAELAESALTSFRDLNWSPGVAWCLYTYAAALLSSGDLAIADPACEGLALAHEIGDAETRIWFLLLIAGYEARRNHGAAASTLIGAAESLAEAIDLTLVGEEARLQRETETAIEHLSPDGFKSHRAAGRTMSPDDAVDYAFASLA